MPLPPASVSLLSPSLLLTRDHLGHPPRKHPHHHIGSGAPLKPVTAPLPSFVPAPASIATDVVTFAAVDEPTCHSRRRRQAPLSPRQPRRPYQSPQSLSPPPPTLTTTATEPPPATHLHHHRRGHSPLPSTSVSTLIYAADAHRCRHSRQPSSPLTGPPLPSPQTPTAAKNTAGLRQGSTPSSPPPQLQTPSPSRPPPLSPPPPAAVMDPDRAVCGRPGRRRDTLRHKKQSTYFGTWTTNWVHINVWLSCLHRSTSENVAMCQKCTGNK